MRNAKKKISSFSTLYIITGLSLILFQFYYIGSEIYMITSSNKVFEEAREELVFLREKKEEKEKIKTIRSTPQYKDRFQKENYDIYQEGEIVLILPPEKEEVDPYDDLTPLEIEWEEQKKKPIPQQWKDLFFKD
jgi:hypothetical protein